jgi:iron complex transport system substrate-binding protein
VVSLIASSTEMVCALDCGEWLVGRSHECDYPEWVRRLPAITSPRLRTDMSSVAIDRGVRDLIERATSVYVVDAEALARLAPDIVITQMQCEVCAVSRRDVEEAIARFVPSRPTIVSLEPNALDDIWRDVARVSEALGVTERGLRLVHRLRRRMRAVAERAATAPARPRVACIEWIEPLMVAGNWTPELIQLAGGESLFGIAGAHAPALAWETLAASDPDIICVAPCGFDIARTRIELPALTDRPGWRDLRAMRDGRVYLGDGNALFNRPGPRVAETLEALAEMLHPEAFRFGHEGTGWVRFSC